MLSDESMQKLLGLELASQYSLIAVPGGWVQGANHVLLFERQAPKVAITGTWALHDVLLLVVARLRCNLRQAECVQYVYATLGSQRA